MSSKPWYAWFPADYRAKTSHLTFEQDSAYRRLLDAYYERRGPLPCEPQALYRMVGAQSEDERAAVSAVAGEFFENGNDQLRHRRCDEQIERESRLHQAWSEGGRKGGLSQAQGRLKLGSSIPHSHSHSHSDLSSKKPRSNSTPRSEAPTVPEWVPKEQWNAWIEARSNRRNPPTNFALSLAIAKLEHLRELGQSPAAVLAQSAFRGWAGLFPVKKETQR